MKRWDWIGRTGLMVCVSVLLAGCGDQWDKLKAEKYGDDGVEIEDGQGWYYAHRGDLMEETSFKVELKHISGPPVKFFALDKAAFEKSKLAGVKSRLLSVPTLYELDVAQGEVTSDWISVLEADELYFRIEQAEDADGKASDEKSKFDVQVWVKD